MSAFDGWSRVILSARRMALMVTQIVPLYLLTQWGVKLKGRDNPISFAELAQEFGVYIERIVRIAGGFYEIPGVVVSPCNREAKGGWEQTALEVVPRDEFGVIALVVDTSTRGHPRFLIEFRPEALALKLENNVVASASAVCSASNQSGAHGYKGNPVYLALLDSLVERAEVPNFGDMARTVKVNEIVILEWVTKSGKSLPDLSGKHYAWCTKLDLEDMAAQGLLSEHLLAALGVFYMKIPY